MRTLSGLLLAGSLVCLMAQASAAVETGSAIKADAIKAEPYRDAKTLGPLAAGDKVTIIKREGGWLMISAPAKGWVRMLSVRRGTSAPGAKVSGIATLASGRAGTGRVVASTGERGLNEEDLKNAKFDEKELKLAESYGVKKNEAEQFAAKARLKSRSVAYLSE